MKANLTKPVIIDSIPQKAPILSALHEILPVLETTQESTLSVSLDSVTATSPLICNQIESFQKLVLPVLEKRNCFECHQVGASAERAIFPKETAPLCALLKARVEMNDPLNSTLIQLPLRGRFGHPIKIFQASEVIP